MCRGAAHSYAQSHPYTVALTDSDSYRHTDTVALTDSDAWHRQFPSQAEPA
jgi:hypothetical protein